MYMYPIVYLKLNYVYAIGYTQEKKYAGTK